MTISTEALTEEVKTAGTWVSAVQNEISRVVVGQRYLVDRLLIGLLANGHVLLEGVPGLAKTLTIRTLAGCIQTGFRRLQFTPDLLPADIVGTLIYNPRDGDFRPKLGPIFSNLILADEINRAPAKVQSALLEAMQERQVTIGEQSYLLPDPFLVLATQNPLEQEGTYQLPEAQLDRFMFNIKVDYPTAEEEDRILSSTTRNEKPDVRKVLSGRAIVNLQKLVRSVPVRTKRGRPVLKFSLTERADASFPKRYGQLATMVLTELQEMGGPELLDQVFERVAHRHAEAVAPTMEGLDFDQRLARLVEWIARAGTLAEREETTEGVRVTIHNCPFRNTALKFPQVCTITPQLIVELLGRPVSQEKSIHRRDPYCSFLVQRPDPAPH